MDKIKIVYIDDDVDLTISQYLNEDYQCDIEKEYYEIPFRVDEDYSSLIENSIVKEANIIIIDSKLFKNDRVTSSKFSGEEFKIVLKKIFPFIEVIVITQNEQEEDFGALAKYRSGMNETFRNYYDRILRNVLDESIHNIAIYRSISEKLNKSEAIDKVLIEKIMDSLEGTSQYDELTTSDIDKIIISFNELKEYLNV